MVWLVSSTQRTGKPVAHCLTMRRLAPLPARPLANESDEELLRRMLTGEEEAFEVLYDRREGLVYQFALRMSGSAALAEDVTQDVFLSLIRHGHQFDAGRGKLAKYLLGMTRNRVLTLLQRERSFVALTDEDEDEDLSLPASLITHEDPLLKLTRAEQTETMRQAILALPLHYREVLVLCNLNELSYEDAAGILSCPVGTVRSRLNRARGLLLDKLRAARQTAEQIVA